MAQSQQAMEQMMANVAVMMEQQVDAVSTMTLPIVMTNTS